MRPGRDAHQLSPPDRHLVAQVMMAYWPPRVATSLVLALRRSNSQEDDVDVDRCSLLTGSSEFCPASAVVDAASVKCDPGRCRVTKPPADRTRAKYREACYSRGGLEWSWRGHFPQMVHGRKGRERTSSGHEVGSYERSGSLMKYESHRSRSCLDKRYHPRLNELRRPTRRTDRTGRVLAA